ncbi:MAG: type I DNA topoisomerase, partial [Magnetococcales bacterium]|nr:type I DNA topoisomerase [Magnetococcales bacterium]
REGEAISWHVLEVLKNRHALSEGVTVQRVVFHEITQKAIQEAISHPRELDMNLVNAQQARRALDYLVGFNLSPLLWKKVRGGLSAGRVQSVALRLICEREREIKAFKPREYWSLTASVRKEKEPKTGFKARLAVVDGKKLGQFDIPDADEANRCEAAVKERPLFVAGVEKKQSKRNPSPPFITSTLQQEASRKLGYSAKRTMALAQKLYEGMELATPDGGREHTGLITYMRTDSVTLAGEAIATLRDVVKERYGPKFLPKSPRAYKSSAKNAQEAHEAIRPTDPRRTPDQLAGVLDPDMLKLYELIWKRTVACQMESALIDQVAANLAVDSADPNAPWRFRATGSSVAFPGFMEVYSEGRDEVSAQDRDEDEEDGMLPPLEVGERLKQTALVTRQHFTEPPPRYTEASLVKTLESFGIGRPSTYAPTMSTIQDRGYAKLEKRQFFPEDVGLVVNDYLVEHFQKYVDYHFTAHLEDDLDAVSRGEREWTPLLNEFWRPFIGQVKEKEKTTNKADVTSEATDEACPECGKPMVIRLGRFGRFMACTGYPECKYKRNLKKEGETEETAPAEPQYSEEKCEKCGQLMLIKDGKYGKYLACSGYPACRNIQPLVKPRETGVPCPLCGKGQFIEKKSRRGKVFFSCSNYPKCKNALWDEPVGRACPKCSAPYLLKKSGGRSGAAGIVCGMEGCDYREGGAVVSGEAAPAKPRATRAAAAKPAAAAADDGAEVKAAPKTTTRRTAVRKAAS